MTKEEAIAYFKEHNESLVSFAKNENVYDYDRQVIEADYMRRCFEANEKAIQALEQSRLKGKWIDDSKEDSYYANCSHCDYQIDTHYERGYLNYCPNCGAEMEVEE